MIVEPIAELSQLLWREQTGRWLKPASTPAPTASFEQPNDDDGPDPPPAAATALPWPRVFPGL